MSLDQSDHPEQSVSARSTKNVGKSGYTLEVSCQCQQQSYTALVEQFIHVSPRCNQHDCFCCISSGCLKDGVHIFSSKSSSGGLIVVLLPSYFQP